MNLNMSKEEERNRTHNGCFPVSPFMMMISNVSRWSTTKLSGPYAAWTLAFAPSVSSLSTAGTSGLSYVVKLNIARFVPSDIVSNVASTAIVVCAGGSSGIADTGTSSMSGTIVYASTVP